MVGRPLEKSHIAVEGTIGVGKSTLARKLADKLGSQLLLESLDDNPFIELYYEDPERHALSAQLSFLFSRLKQWQSIPQQDLFHQGLVSDYIFAKDRLFASVTLTDEEYRLYDQVARLVSVDVPRPDLVIYLQADIEEILKRVSRRGRDFEKNIAPDYLRKVAGAYERFFFNYQETPLLIVQTDKLNFADNDASLDALLHRVAQMRSGTEFWADHS